MSSQLNGMLIPGVSPVLILGMHRSGASLLADALGRCGLFLGADAQDNHESKLLMFLNDTLFHNCHATWNSPLGIHLALKNEQVVAALARLALDSFNRSASNYLGIDRPDGVQQLAGINFPWGWKDPRSIFTLPVWGHVFPNAKIIHIKRHGVDVANSLFKQDYIQQGNEYIMPLVVMQDEAGLQRTRRGQTLEQAFTIWEEYIGKASEQMALHANSTLEIKYEDLLQQPEFHLKKAMEFCGLENTTIPADLVASIDKSRAYAYKEKPELVEFADRWKDALGYAGY